MDALTRKLPDACLWWSDKHFPLAVTDAEWHDCNKKGGTLGRAWPGRPCPLSNWALLYYSVVGLEIAWHTPEAILVRWDKQWKATEFTVVGWAAPKSSRPDSWKAVCGV
jgi:hypothetical protein